MQDALADRVERGLIQRRTLRSERNDERFRATAAADEARRLRGQLHALREKVRLQPTALVGTAWRAIEIAEAWGTLKETMAALLLGDAFFRAYKDLESMTGTNHASLPSAEREPGNDEVRAALQRLIASEAFRASNQLAVFLRFVVEAKLRGESRQIKEYTIAVEAFGRGEHFDARFDPIVRVAAGRLRRALEHYYTADGPTDAILIDIPRGHYVPEFRYRLIEIGTTTRRTSIAEALLHLRKWLSK